MHSSLFSTPDSNRSASRTSERSSPPTSVSSGSPAGWSSPTPRSTTTSNTADTSSPVTPAKAKGKSTSQQDNFKVPVLPCLRCDLAGYDCSWEGGRTRRKHEEAPYPTPCFRCARNKESICIAQAWEWKRVGARTHRVKSFIPYLPGIDLAAVMERGRELVEPVIEKEQRKNWVLPSIDGKRVTVRLDEDGKRY
jgi:hypothetical protein